MSQGRTCALKVYLSLTNARYRKRHAKVVVCVARPAEECFLARG